MSNGQCINKSVRAVRLVNSDWCQWADDSNKLTAVFLVHTMSFTTVLTISGAEVCVDYFRCIQWVQGGVLSTWAEFTCWLITGLDGSSPAVLTLVHILSSTIISMILALFCVLCEVEITEISAVYKCSDVTVRAYTVTVTRSDLEI